MIGPDTTTGPRDGDMDLQTWGVETGNENAPAGRGAGRDGNEQRIGGAGAQTGATARTSLPAAFSLGSSCICIIGSARRPEANRPSKTDPTLLFRAGQAVQAISRYLVQCPHADELKK